MSSHILRSILPGRQKRSWDDSTAQCSRFIRSHRSWKRGSSQKRRTKESTLLDLRQALLELEEVQKDSGKHLLPCSFTLGSEEDIGGETGGRISEMKQKVCSVLIVLLSGPIFLGCSPAPGSEEASSSPVPTFRIPSQQGMPPDIDPESRSRLPLKHREDLDADGQDLYDFFVDPASRTEGVMGPRGFYLYSIRAGRHLALANEYLRFESGLDARTRELAILLAVREMNGQYQWTSMNPQHWKWGWSPRSLRW